MRLETTKDCVGIFPVWPLQVDKQKLVFLQMSLESTFAKAVWLGDGVAEIASALVWYSSFFFLMLIEAE